ncbi:hypothetical protein CBM2588_A40065 [Cupriavidus taiwanensis]|nr:hypothetical protein CBM2588_A40065 [Cupriavidus taiwanensis]
MSFGATLQQVTSILGVLLELLLTFNYFNNDFSCRVCVFRFLHFLRKGKISGILSGCRQTPAEQICKCVIDGLSDPDGKVL